MHYIDVIMGVMASQVTSLTMVYSTVYWGADQRRHQNSASLAFVRGIHRGPVNSPHKGSVTRKMFPFDDVIMAYSLDEEAGMCNGLLLVKSTLISFVSIFRFDGSFVYSNLDFNWTNRYNAHDCCHTHRADYPDWDWRKTTCWFRIKIDHFHITKI